MRSKKILKKQASKKKASNTESNKKLNEVFNGQFLLYLLIIVIPSTLLLNEIFQNKTLSDQIQLFFVTAIVTGIVLYNILKEKDNNISLLEDTWVIYFIVIVGLIILYMSASRMFRSNLYSLNGGMFFIIFVLTIVIVYNIISVMINI